MATASSSSASSSTLSPKSPIVVRLFPEDHRDEQRAGSAREDDLCRQCSRYLQAATKVHSTAINNLPTFKALAWNALGQISYARFIALLKQGEQLRSCEASSAAAAATSTSSQSVIEAKKTILLREPLTKYGIIEAHLNAQRALQRAIGTVSSSLSRSPPKKQSPPDIASSIGKITQTHQCISLLLETPLSGDLREELTQQKACTTLILAAYNQRTPGAVFPPHAPSVPKHLEEAIAHTQKALNVFIQENRKIDVDQRVERDVICLQQMTMVEDAKVSWVKIRVTDFPSDQQAFVQGHIDDILCIRELFLSIHAEHRGKTDSLQRELTGIRAEAQSLRDRLAVVERRAGAAEEAKQAAKAQAEKEQQAVRDQLADAERRAVAAEEAKQAAEARAEKEQQALRGQLADAERRAGAAEKAQQAAEAQAGKEQQALRDQLADAERRAVAAEETQRAAEAQAEKEQQALRGQLADAERRAGAAEEAKQAAEAQAEKEQQALRGQLADAERRAGAAEEAQRAAKAQAEKELQALRRKCVDAQGLAVAAKKAQRAAEEETEQILEIIREHSKTAKARLRKISTRLGEILEDTRAMRREQDERAQRRRAMIDSMSQEAGGSVPADPLPLSQPSAQPGALSAVAATSPLATSSALPSKVSVRASTGTFGSSLRGQQSSVVAASLPGGAPAASSSLLASPDAQSLERAGSHFRKIAERLRQLPKVDIVATAAPDAQVERQRILLGVISIEMYGVQDSQKLKKITFEESETNPAKFKGLATLTPVIICIRFAQPLPPYVFKSYRAGIQELYTYRQRTYAPCKFFTKEDVVQGKYTGVEPSIDLDASFNEDLVSMVKIFYERLNRSQIDPLSWSDVLKDLDHLDMQIPEKEGSSSSAATRGPSTVIRNGSELAQALAGSHKAFIPQLIVLRELFKAIATTTRESAATAAAAAALAVAGTEMQRRNVHLQIRQCSESISVLENALKAILLPSSLGAEGPSSAAAAAGTPKRG